MKIFDTTTALAAATLTAGQMVSVKEIGDYRIKASGSGITLANSNVAVPVASGTAVNVKQFGAVGDGVTDDTAAIQAALDASAGKTLHFGMYETYKTTSTLNITGHVTSIYGNNSTIDYYGSVHAIGYNLVGGTTYPVSMYMQDLSVLVRSAASGAGIQVRTSNSQFRNVGVVLYAAATSAKGFVLVGDETNGTGPYYNSFHDCTVQSQSLSTDHTGIFFSTQAPVYRGPNANQFIGGRIGQCLTGAYITGNGNTFTGVTIENAAGLGTCYDLVSPAASKNTGNQILGGYVENAATVVSIDSSTLDTKILMPYVTGATTPVSDSSPSATIIGSATATYPNKIASGFDFANVSASSTGTVLDHYEEGTWTPTLVGASTAGDYTVTGTGCTFTRIGNTVHVRGRLAIAINSAGSGTLLFGGLPYAKANNQYITGAVLTTNIAIDAAVSGLSVVGTTSSASSQFSIAGNRSGTSKLFNTCADLSGGAVVEVCMSYQTS